MKCHLVRKFLCAAPNLPFNETEPGKRHQITQPQSSKKHSMHNVRTADKHSALTLGFTTISIPPPNCKKLVGFMIHKLH